MFTFDSGRCVKFVVININAKQAVHSREHVMNKSFCRTLGAGMILAALVSAPAMALDDDTVDSAIGGGLGGAAGAAIGNEVSGKTGAVLGGAAGAAGGAYITNDGDNRRDNDHRDYDRDDRHDRGKHHRHGHDD